VQIWEFHQVGLSYLCASPSPFIAFKDRRIDCLGITFYGEMLRTLKHGTELLQLKVLIKSFGCDITTSSFTTIAAVATTLFLYVDLLIAYG